MSELDRSIRIRALLDEWFTLLLLVFIVLAAVGGWWSYQVHATPEVEQNEVVIEQWSESTAYDHSAVITNDSLVFNEGERVRNRPVYYVSLSREVDVTYSYQHTAEDGSVDVTTDMQLQYRGTEGDTVLWQYSEPLASQSEENITADEPHTVNATIDIDSVFDTITTVEQELGAAGSIQIRVISTSNVEGTLGGQSVSNTYESTMPITVNPQTLRVLEMETIDESGERTDTVEQTVAPTTAETIGSSVVLIVGIGVLGALLLARKTGYIHLSQEDRELLETYQQEQEFSEWITHGTFPSERDYEATILVDDLEGLVDVAIDTNKRVIKDEQLGVSTVLDDDYVYVYVRPDSPAGDWLVNYADMTIDEFEAERF